MAGAIPEERVRRAVVQQSWRDVTFLHWRIGPEILAPHLPRALVPDVVDGSAWVSLTPFRVERFRVLGLPPVPVVSSFSETNLRTYVRDADGRDGLWFLSLDVSSTVNAAFGRLAVPYHLARMSVTDDGQLRYRCRRLVGPAAQHDIRIEVGEPLGAGHDGDVAASLSGRWRAFPGAAGRALAVVPVEHEPWPLCHARLVDIDESISAAAGLPEPAEEPLVHFSAGVDARLGPPRPIGH